MFLYLIFTYFYLFWFIIIFFLSSYNFVRIISFYFYICLFILSFLILLLFNKIIIWYQFIIIFNKIFFLNISYIFGIDGISILFLLLSSFLLMFCFFIYWYLRYCFSFYTCLLFFSLWILFNVFTSLDIFIFYIFFELIIIPMFLFIGIWGSRTRKLYAAYQFFFFTLSGSVLILIAFFSMYLNKGSSSFEFVLNSFYFEKREFFYFLLLFFGFSVKIPTLPFHIWLPEAHVEAPTPGSVILAGILLKLGSYAILRFLLSSFIYVSHDLIFFLLIIAFLGFVYTSLIALNQIDIKKIIAYSSIAHMNFSLFGFFCQNILGLNGSFFMMYGHAITSSALFLGIGVLYDRYKTRIIYYYSQIAIFMPFFSFFYFIFILSNFGFPGTVNFVGEFLITVGGIYISIIIILFSALALILSVVYSLFLYNRIFFGFLQKYWFIRYFCDLIRLEFYILILFFFLIIILGFFPNLIFEISYSNLSKIIIINT